MTMTNKQFNLKEIYIDELPDFTINQLPEIPFQIFLFHPAVALLVSQRFFF